MKEKKMEAERDDWFNRVRLIVLSGKTWKEKRIAREEANGSGSSGDEGSENVEGGTAVDVNMVFQLPIEFCLLEPEAAQLALGAERAMFEKLEVLGEHMKPLYIKGNLNGRPVNHMLVDGRACVNIMPVMVFERLGNKEDELKRTNMTLSSFSSEPSNAKGIVSMELTVGSKTVLTAFLVVDVKGRYNVLLGRDWIHTNGCVTSMLHQCVIQWVGDSAEVVKADESDCIAMAESQGDLQDEKVKCLTGRDLTDYDYISMGRDGLVLVNVKLMVVNWLEHTNVINGE
jgi:hypothetical protein